MGCACADKWIGEEFWECRRGSESLGEKVQGQGWAQRESYQNDWDPHMQQRGHNENSFFVTVQQMLLHNYSLLSEH